MKLEKLFQIKNYFKLFLLSLSAYLPTISTANDINPCPLPEKISTVSSGISYHHNPAGWHIIQDNTFQRNPSNLSEIAFRISSIDAQGIITAEAIVCFYDGIMIAKDTPTNTGKTLQDFKNNGWGTAKNSKGREVLYCYINHGCVW